jgi:hypothetical protein
MLPPLLFSVVLKCRQEAFEQVNARKTQKNQLYPMEAERYAAKLLAKAEIIVASANKIWGMCSSHVPWNSC